MKTPSIASTPLFLHYASLLAQAAALSASRLPHDQVVGFMVREQCRVFLDEHPAIAEGIVAAGKQQDQNRKERAQRQRDEAKRWGPDKWGEWHLRALKVEAEFVSAGQFGRDAIMAAELNWLNKTYAPSIPCGECKFNFLLLLKRKPLPVSLENYFAYTHEIHGDVSSECGNPAVTLEDARAYWTAKS